MSTVSSRLPSGAIGASWHAARIGKEGFAMERDVHVPFTVGRDEDRVWCAHAQLRPRGWGAHGEGETRYAAV